MLAIDNNDIKADDVEIKINVTLDVSEVVKVTDLTGSHVPVATNDDKPVGGQIANAVIAKNTTATINDFNIPDDSVIVTKKPVDGASDDDYQYGTYTAKLNGAGKYTGSLDIKGTFGRLVSKLQQELKEDKTKKRK